MGLLDAFKAKYGAQDGEKIYVSQRKLASAAAAHKRTKAAVERRRQPPRQQR